MTDLSIREAITWIRGAVSTKDLVPILTHIAITDGTVSGFDGRVLMRTPCPALSGIEAAVPARKFLAAIDAAGPVSPFLTHADNVLTIRAGRFKASLPTLPLSDFPLALPTPTNQWALQSGFKDALRALRPLVGDDASRPWANGVWFTGKTACATNNVALAVYDLPASLPWAGILPSFAIDEILRIEETPIQASSTPDSLVLWYASGGFLKTRLLDGEWPRSPFTMLDEAKKGIKFQKLPATLAASVESIIPFCPQERAPHIVLANKEVRTQGGGMGAVVAETLVLKEECTFHAEPLRIVLSRATEAAFDRYPSILWRGSGMRGLLLGMRT